MSATVASKIPPVDASDLADIWDAIEAQSRAFAVLALVLHSSGHIDGRRVAVALRLDRTGHPAGDESLIELGNLVGRAVDQLEAGNVLGPRAVEQI